MASSTMSFSDPRRKVFVSPIILSCTYFGQAIELDRIYEENKTFNFSFIRSQKQVLVREGYLERARVWKHRLYKVLPHLLSFTPSPNPLSRKGLCLNIFGTYWVYVQFLDGICLCKVRRRIWSIFFIPCEGKKKHYFIIIWILQSTGIKVTDLKLCANFDLILKF